MTKIVGFAGKKQSGKNTCCNFILMLKLMEYGVCKNAKINDDGEIEVSDIFGDQIKGQEWFLFKKPLVNTDELLNQLGVIKIYALADALKRIAIDILGLPEEKVYGTDEDKKTKTHLLWENMPGVFTPKDLDYLTFDGKYVSDYNLAELGIFLHDPGPMTIREVLQFMGTEIFRKIMPNVWIESLINKIEKDKPEVALICDVRFDNEITALKNKQAIIIGLTKDKFKSNDNHASEQVNLELCDKIIQNGHLSIGDQNREIYLALQQLKCNILPEIGV